MVDNHTNRPISFAPIFDNGLSLFNFAMDDEIENLKEYSKSRPSAFKATFNQIAEDFISERQREKLRK